MIIPDSEVVTVSVLREVLNLSRTRPESTRDVLAVLCGADETPVPLTTDVNWPLALGRWPETWRQAPATGPQYLVSLCGLASPYLITGIWETEPDRWGHDSGTDLSRRTVPLRSPAYAAAAALAGRYLDTSLTFGWLHAEEQFAFL